MTTVPAFDATGSDLSSVPPAIRAMQSALYITGSGGVAASTAQLAAYPDAVLIDQAPTVAAIDKTAHAFDMEAGAVTLEILAEVVNEALANFRAGTTQGQRAPLVYASASNATPVVNALIAGNVPQDGSVGLWLAHWGITEADAEAMVLNASGPYPVRGAQYENYPTYDADVFDAAWLDNRVRKVDPVSAIQIVKPLPGWWEKGGTFIGIGADGNLYSTTYNFATNEWSAPVMVS
jgi:hypothetical protein